MSMERLLFDLKELAEGRQTLEAWEHSRQTCEEDVEPLLSPRLYLLLKIRPLLAAPEVLRGYSIPCVQSQFQCHRCGNLLFFVLAGKTTQKEILEFASRVTDRVIREIILRSRGMNTGIYCPTFCTNLPGYVNYSPPELAEEEVRLLFQEQVKEAERARFEAEIFSARGGEKICVQCGQRLVVWADTKLRRCGYCRHPIELPAET